MSFDELLTYVPPGINQGHRTGWFDEDGQERDVKFISVWKGDDSNDDSPGELVVDDARAKVLDVEYDNLGLFTFEIQFERSSDGC